MVGFKQVYNLLPTELCEKVYSYYDELIKRDFNRVLDELMQTVREKSIWKNPSERLISLCCGLGMFQFSYRKRHHSPQVLCEPMFDTHLSDNFNHMIYVNWNLYDEYIDIRIVSEDMKEEEDYDENSYTTKTRFILSEDQGFLKFGGSQMNEIYNTNWGINYDDFVLGHDVDLNAQQINEIYDKSWNIKNDMYVEFEFIYTDENLMNEEWNKNKFKDTNKVFI